MNNKEQIDKIVEEAINSVDNLQRAVPAPFLLTRINARLSKAQENTWEKMTRFIARPAVAITGLIILGLVNVTAIVVNRQATFIPVAEQSLQPPSDEFSYAVANIYDIENTEP